MYGTPLISQTLSSDSSNWVISGIPTTYEHLYIIWTSKNHESMFGPQAYWTYNNSTTPGNVANTSQSGYEGNGVQNFGYGPENYIRQRSQARLDAGPNTYSQYRTLIPNYSSTNSYKTILGETLGVFGGPYDTTRQSNTMIVNCYNSNDQLTSVAFGSNWTYVRAGSTVRIYGLDS